MVCLYITLSRSNAKRIFWPKIMKVLKEFNTPIKANESDLSIHFDNGSVIYLSGAKDKSEIEKFRGLDIKLVYIDESQAFRTYIEELVNEVLAPALFDHNGTICLIGTPGPVPSGYFYSSSHNSEWSNHSWTMHNNPHIELKSGKRVPDLIEEELARMGVTIDDPRIQREFFAKWVVDLNSLVFKYSKELNHYDALPDLNRHVLGIDIGFDDADAIAVIGWDEKRPEAYLVEEDVKPKQTISELADKIGLYITKYRPISIVMDTGGLGKKIAEEIRRRYGIPVKAAEKSRKFEYIELLNDALRTAKFLAKSNSIAAQDSMMVEWDRDKQTPDKKYVSTKFHSDILDAVLYGYREALHWLYVPPVILPSVNTPAWYKAKEDKLLDQMIEKNQNKDNEDVGFSSTSPWESEW